MKEKGRSLLVIGALAVCLLLALMYLFYLPRNLYYLEIDVATYAIRGDREIFDLSPGHIVGQTFVSNHKNLARIDVKLENGDFRHKSLWFHLKEDPGDSTSVATIALSVGSFQTIRFGDYLAVNFPVQRDSMGKQYYFCIESPFEEDGAFGILYSLNDTYPEGTMYVNHLAVDGDLVFRTRYLISTKER